MLTNKVCALEVILKTIGEIGIPARSAGIPISPITQIRQSGRPSEIFPVESQ